MYTLTEDRIVPTEVPLPQRAADFVAEGLKRAKQISCFDFVPSNYALVYAALAGMPRGRFCEWGSGMGIVAGLAEMLGHQSHGIETDEQLAAASRLLLSDFGLSTTIQQGDVFEIQHDADLYFVYCWPSQICRTEEHFLLHCPDAAQLIILHGAEDIRRVVKTPAK